MTTSEDIVNEAITKANLEATFPYTTKAWLMCLVEACIRLGYNQAITDSESGKPLIKKSFDSFKPNYDYDQFDGEVKI